MSVVLEDLDLLRVFPDEWVYQHDNRNQRSEIWILPKIMQMKGPTVFFDKNDNLWVDRATAIP